LVAARLALASSIHIGGWKWTGNFTTLDLIAAGINALNGALLARRPDHYKNFTVVGIMAMALLMGLGGGITRDVLVNQFPGALTNPAYITVAVICGIIGYLLAYRQGQMFREGLLQFMTSFRCRCMPSSAPRRASLSASRSWACWRWRSSGPPPGGGMWMSPAASHPSTSSAANGSSASPC
jgi:uncharacterized membrane protein YeiH